MNNRETAGQAYAAALAALDAGDVDSVVEACMRAVTLDNGHGPSWILLARLCLETGEVETAAGALARIPHSAPAGVLCDAATIWGRLGRPDAAEEILRDGLALSAADPTLLGALAALLRELGRWAEATSTLALAIARAGAPLSLLVDHARAADAAGVVDEAAAAWAAASDAAPLDVALLNQRAVAAIQRGAADDAVDALRRAVAQEPGLPDLWENLARAQSLVGDGAATRASLEQALLAGAQHTPSIRWLRARSVPVVVASTAEAHDERRRYGVDVAAVAGALDLDTPVGRAEALDAIQDAFHVHYLGEPLLELQRLHGGLVHRIVQSAVPTAPPVHRSAVGRRLRVAFVSSFLCEHTVARLFDGWIRGLDPRRFEVLGFHLGVHADHRSRTISDSCAAFEHLRGDVRDCADQVLRCEADVLIYPELGMDARALRLAALRLSPVQCAAWGHPVTTGLPTVDWFLSSDLMEPPDGERHYTERLLRLPNLSVAVEPTSPGAVVEGRAGLGLPADGPLYAVCQSLFKILPEQDDLLARIALEVPDARFAFVAHPSLRATEAFEARLRAAFEARGLAPARHIFVLPRLPWRRYLDLNLASDVFLDTVGWSGGQTTLEAVACGLLPVTSPGATMRSRHTAAILRRAGVDDTVAPDTDAYVQVAVRLGLDAGWRSEVRARLRAGSAQIWRDQASVRALEGFIEDVACG